MEGQEPKSDKPKTVGRYRYNPGDLVGRGASGAVYAGRNIETGERVAVKVVDKLSFADSFCLEKLQSEVDIVQKLKHPNIVQFLDIYQTHRNVYVITELCEQDLKHWLQRRGTATEEQATRMLRDILAGFRYLTANGVLHRDLKPANILLKCGTCKLGDFGFAKNLHSGADTVLKSVVGTPLYMSPQLLSHLPYTSKSDLWSVGLIYYQLLHGCTPWAAQSQIQLLGRILNEPVRYSPQISSRARHFIESCLQVNECDRLSWDEAFQHPINEPFRFQSPNRQRFLREEKDKSSGKENIQPRWENLERRKPSNMTIAQISADRPLKGNMTMAFDPSVRERPTSKSIRQVRMSRVTSQSKCLRPFGNRNPSKTPTRIAGMSIRDIRML